MCPTDTFTKKEKRNCRDQLSEKLADETQAVCSLQVYTMSANTEVL